MATGASNCRPRHPAGRRPQGPADANPAARLSSSRCSASATSCWRSTRSTSSASTEAVFERDRRATSRPLPAQLGFRAVDGDPDVGALWRQRSHARRRHALVRRPVAARPSRDGRRRRRDRGRQPFRFPVQWVNRPNPDFRGYAGTVAAGTVRPGDECVVASSGETTTVARVIVTATAIVRRRRGGRRRHPDADATRSTSPAATCWPTPHAAARRSPTSSPRT